MTWGHGSLVLNEHIASDGTVDNTKVTDTILTEGRDSDPSFRDGRDAYHLAQGGLLGRVHKGLGYWRLQGRILVPEDANQVAKLADRERALRAAFDPYLCYLDSLTTEGAYSLDWNEPTTDLANFATGVIPMRIHARPAMAPSIRETLPQRPRKDWAVGLVLPDPRIYHQTEQSLALTPGSASGNVVNLGNVPSSLKATIVMAGAGASNFRILGVGGLTFQMDLSTTVNLDSIVVIFETCGPYGRGRLITKNGVENFALKTSAVDTWLTVPVGTTSFSIANTTNVTSCTLRWRSAWA